MSLSLLVFASLLIIIIIIFVMETENPHFDKLGLCIIRSLLVSPFYGG